MDSMKSLDKKIRDTMGNRGILGNLSLNLRGCDCEVITLNFNGLFNDTFKEKKDELLSVLDEFMPDWDIYYITAFP
ncbi:MAG: hypothetical protein J7M18_02310 [Candidatus Eremiobacteraeota bacterium]|nr:hypothetical protein [Candidatus Eremiobacteraeota bacterium]